MLYYRLNDEVNIARRWHLGEVCLSDGATLDLLGSKPLAILGLPSVDVTTAGRALDFCLTSFAVPVARSSLADAISGVTGADVQRIPIRIDENAGFEAPNALRSVTCLNEAQSEFTKWTEKDHRSDLAGQYRMVLRLRVDGSAVPAGCHVFRIQGWSVALIVSERVKQAMEDAGCEGAKFELVN